MAIIVTNHVNSDSQQSFVSTVIPIVEYSDQDLYFYDDGLTVFMNFAGKQW